MLPWCTCDAVTDVNNYPFKPCSTLLITSYCTLCRKDSLCALVRRFCVSRNGGTGGGGWRVLCTWQLLGLVVKGPWLAMGGPILGLAAWTGLENTTLTFQGVHFWPSSSGTTPLTSTLTFTWRHACDWISQAFLCHFAYCKLKVGMAWERGYVKVKVYTPSLIARPIPINGMGIKPMYIH